jgi:penicillin-binding protein 1C
MAIPPRPASPVPALKNRGIGRLCIGGGLGLVVAVVVVIGVLVWPLTRPPFPADYSTAVLDRDGDILRVFLNDREQWHLPPRPDAAVPEKLTAAVLLFEDGRFWSHPGVDPFALLRAAWSNLRAGRVVSGASTLTMQVARLMRPKARTLIHKLGEMLLALRLEYRYNKDDILRLYLDHAPYGGNIVGYRAAAWRYFGKDPARLTWGEAATLAVLPNAPGLVSPTADAGRLKQKRDQLLQRLQAQGHIDSSTGSLAQREAIAAGVHPFPRLAPHLTRRLKGAGRWLQTGIDIRLQRQAAAQVRRYAGFLRRLGVQNVAALIAETGSGQVRAYVGSQDFSDHQGLGQVDGVVAPRSSGSLLKPFLYALAMDEGLALPQTLLEDIPLQYGTFAPRNADERFSGLVTARQALVRSLNVPAVHLLRQYGIFPFYHFLQEAGVSTLFRRADDYGLPLIIGGAEVNLWDMAGLFRGLGQEGRFASLDLLAEAGPGTRLLSPEAAYLTLEVLRQVDRPGAEYYWRQYQDRWPLAWKTGTSYGHRDAWAVGVSPQWVVAVWAGNFSGGGNANLAGAATAGPLLFDLFNALPKDERRRWFVPPPSMGAVEVCAISGYTAGSHCPDKIQVPAPAAMKALTLCPYHRTLFVNRPSVNRPSVNRPSVNHASVNRSPTDTVAVEQAPVGLGGDPLVQAAVEQVCSLCWGEAGHRAEQWLVLPPEVASHVSFIAAPPSHRSSCPAQAEAVPLRLVYPRPGSRLRLGRDFDGAVQPIVFRAAHRDDRRTLHWYLDQRYLGQTRLRHTRAVTLEPGWHTLEVVDQSGHRSRSRFMALADGD